ncbi:MAG: ABC transporter ATP-binding protein [Dehalococcoidales bacterium]|nr:ABC transporter ATP-binding protein [Dehalococcoidales bacterium]
MIKVRNLWVDLGEFVLKDANMDINQGEYFVILGPTGAGKTVLLESIAGLYPLKEGRIWLNDEEVTRLEPEKRGISIVYQDQMLFPHLSVRDNITFGLRIRKMRPAEIERTLSWLAGLLDIHHLLGRKPDTLSGGEKQKVALARALSVKPKLLLLDEPLSALDPNSREILQRELRNIHEEYRVTTVHVTHDFEEAIALADRVAVIGDGCVQQVGTPEQIFRQPGSEFVARFAMVRNIFRGEVIEGENGDALFCVDGVSLSVVTGYRGQCHASLRPEDIIISHAPFPSSARNTFSGMITSITDKGATLLLTIHVPPDFICLITRNSFDAMALSIGDTVYITFKASAVNIF